jgi:hypothetical protein
MVGFLEPAPRRLPSRGAILIFLSGLTAWLALLLWTFAALVRPKTIGAGHDDGDADHPFDCLGDRRTNRAWDPIVLVWPGGAEDR